MSGGVQVKTVTFVAKTLEDAGFRVATLHGERSQAEREVRQHVVVIRSQGGKRDAAKFLPAAVPARPKVASIAFK